MTKQARWLTEDEQHLWRLLLAASTKVSKTIDDRLQSVSEISSPEFAVLVTLSETDEHALRLRELCNALGWDRSRASHQITRMAKRGLVTKGKSPGDARGVLVSLTDDGMARLEDAVPDHVETVRRLVFDHITPQRAKVLSEAFTDIVEAEHVPDDVPDGGPKEQD